MAEYVFSEVFFKGNKQAVVDFLNRGLKGAEVAERVSVQMSGEAIVNLLNGLKEDGIGMGSYVPQPEIDGSRESKPIDRWQLLYDQEDSLCIFAQLDTEELPPLPFLFRINGLDDVTVYAFGCMPPDGCVYLFHGRLQAVSLIDPYKDCMHAKYLKTLDPDDYEEEDMPIEAANMVQQFYMDVFSDELSQELNNPSLPPSTRK